MPSASLKTRLRNIEKLFAPARASVVSVILYPAQPQRFGKDVEAHVSFWLARIEAGLMPGVNHRDEPNGSASRSDDLCDSARPENLGHEVTGSAGAGLADAAYTMPQLGEYVMTPSGLRLIEGVDAGVPFVVVREAGLIRKEYVATC